MFETNSLTIWTLKASPSGSHDTTLSCPPECAAVNISWSFQGNKTVWLVDGAVVDELTAGVLGVMPVVVVVVFVVGVDGAGGFAAIDVGGTIVGVFLPPSTPAVVVTILVVTVVAVSPPTATLRQIMAGDTV